MYSRISTFVRRPPCFTLCCSFCIHTRRTFRCVAPLPFEQLNHAAAIASRTHHYPVSTNAYKSNVVDDSQCSQMSSVLYLQTNERISRNGGFCKGGGLGGGGEVRRGNRGFDDASVSNLRRFTISTGDNNRLLSKHESIKRSQPVRNHRAH